jgi:hypothetical protein
MKLKNAVIYLNGLDGEIMIYVYYKKHTPKEGIEKKWESEWGYKCIFASYSSNSRGVAILLNNSFQHTIHPNSTQRRISTLIYDIYRHCQR